MFRIIEGAEDAAEEVSEFDFSDMAVNVTDEVDDAMDSIGIDSEAVNDAIDDGVENIDDSVEKVPDLVEDGGKMVGNLVHGALTAFGNLLGNAMEFLNDAVDSVDSTVADSEAGSTNSTDARSKRFAGSK